MKKIIAFGASTSKSSINKRLAHYAANQLKDAELQLLDLNDFEMPLFSVDLEAEIGANAATKRFKQLILESDGIIISFAEHNGGFAAAFKNIFDWVSREEGKVWERKPMFLLATSPGARGGQAVLDNALTSFPHRGGNILASFSLPSFNDNFSEEGIVDEALRVAFEEQLRIFWEGVTK